MEFLKGIKVIELAGVLAGPSVGMFLAELGAEVVKIEGPNGDVTRHFKLSSENENDLVSAYFSSVNYLKKYQTADFNNKKDLERVKNLILESDIVLTNFKPGDAEKFELSYDNFKENQKLIYASITGFGNDDNRAAFDVVLQAEAGYMFMNGEEKSNPVKIPVALMDVLAAHQLKEAILIALMKRQIENKGSFIEVNLYQSAISSLSNQASNYLMENFIPKRMGSAHPNICPYGDIITFKQNKNLVLAIGSDKQFIQLCDLLNVSELYNNPMFSSNLMRVKNRASLIKKLNQICNALELETYLPLFHKNKIPCGEIKNLEEVFKDPKANELIREEIIEGKITKRVSSIAFKIN